MRRFDNPIVDKSRLDNLIEVSEREALERHREPEMVFPSLAVILCSLAGTGAFKTPWHARVSPRIATKLVSFLFFTGTC